MCQFKPNIYTGSLLFISQKENTQLFPDFSINKNSKITRTHVVQSQIHNDDGLQITTW
jgi:hypothetical protein